MLDIEFERQAFNWNELQKHVDYIINDSYKEFYERIPGVALDAYIYINGLRKHEPYARGLSYMVDYTLDAYSQLKYGLRTDQEIDFGPHCENWLPVGTTTGGDFVVCNNDQVMVLDEGFEDREIYDDRLFDFVMHYINDELQYGRVIDDAFVGKKKRLMILD